MRHYSWTKPASVIKRKLDSYGHSHEIYYPNWYEEVFLSWTPEVEIKNFHPTEPKAYKNIVRCEYPIPECMVGHPYLNRDVVE